MEESRTGKLIFGAIFTITGILILIAVLLSGEAKRKPINLFLWVPVSLMGPTLGLAAFANTLKARFVMVTISTVTFGTFLVGLGMIALIDSGDFIFGMIMIIGSVFFIILLLSTNKDKYLKKMKENSTP